MLHGQGGKPFQQFKRYNEGENIIRSVNALVIVTANYTAEPIQNHVLLLVVKLTG